jgi:hypothetical protein
MPGQVVGPTPIGSGRRYLLELYQLTGRPVIVYSSAFMDKASGDLAISLGDVQGFMNAVHGIDARTLDLMITTPGGSPEATESIVAYLRTRFDHIRAIVPLAAMSAGTMLALACDEIIMGGHSQLGPIDPQFTLPTPDGPRSAPGQAILDQFESAKQDFAAHPQNLAAWMPILRSLAPGLLAICDDQREVAKRMAQAWLQEYMLRDDVDREAKAKSAADWFADYDYFGSHGRRVSLADVQALGLKATSLESDQALQDAVLTVHHCFSLTLSNTPATKIIENHLGKAYVKISGEIVPITGPAPPRGPPQPVPPSPPPGNRANRRRQARGR